MRVWNWKGGRRRDLKLDTFGSISNSLFERCPIRLETGEEILLALFKSFDLVLLLGDFPVYLTDEVFFVECSRIIIDCNHNFHVFGFRVIVNEVDLCCAVFDESTGDDDGGELIEWLEADYNAMVDFVSRVFFLQYLDTCADLDSVETCSCAKIDFEFDAVDFDDVFVGWSCHGMLAFVG